MIMLIMFLGFVAIATVATVTAYHLDQAIDKRFMEEFGELFE